MLLDLNQTLDSVTAQSVFWSLGALLLLVLGRELRHVPAKLLVLMATAFLDMVGLFIVVPLMQFYVKEYVPEPWHLFGAEIAVGTITGLVMSTFVLAQLLTAPFWGRCSDRYGRRPVLVVALSASSLAFLLFGFANSLWMLALSRIVQGAGGGTVGVVQAYVADAVEPAQRARALGWLSAATNLGVAFGPVLGSGAVWLGQHDLWPGEAVVKMGNSAPGVLAALLCAANAFFASRYLVEPVQHAARPAQRTSIGTAISQVVFRPQLPASRVILIYAVAIGAAQGVNQLFATLLDRRFGVDKIHIGYLFMYIGTIAVFARVLLLGWLVDRLGEVRLSRVGIVVLAVALFGVQAAHNLPMLALVFALLPIGMALTFPCVTSLLSRLVPGNERGLFMGMQQTFGGLARLTPPLYGWAFDNWGESSPFYAASAVVLATLLLGIGLGRSTAVAPAA